MPNLIDTSVGQEPKRGPGRPRGSVDRQRRKIRSDREPDGPPPEGAILCSPAQAQAMGHWPKSIFFEKVLPGLTSFKQGRRRKIVVQSVRDFIARQIAAAAERGELIEPRPKIATADNQAALPDTKISAGPVREPDRPRSSPQKYK